MGKIGEITPMPVAGEEGKLRRETGGVLRGLDLIGQARGRKAIDTQTGSFTDHT